MRWLRASSLLLVAVLAAAPVPAPAIEQRGPVRVIDGDTLDIGGQRLRLQGIDAPERGAVCRDGAGRDWPCGDWARRELAALLRTGRLACIDLDERTHGRIVARCDLNGQDLGAQLIARGLVRSCPRYAARHPHSRVYPGLEDRAIVRRVGLHAGQTPPRAGFCTTGAAPAVPAGTGAAGCHIKGNIARDGARIYHRPGQRHYAATVIDPRRGERWFCSAAEAEAEGWRPARQ